VQQGRQVSIHVRDQGLPIDDLPVAKGGRHQRQVHQRVRRPQQRHGDIRLRIATELVVQPLGVLARQPGLTSPRRGRSLTGGQWSLPQAI
jgi:hypothetical protein